MAYAQEKAAGALDEVIVTAQKRTENLQDVPVSIQALGTEKLEELHVASLDDYVKFLPSISVVRSIGQGGNAQPGNAHVYVRGVVAGGEGGHSGSQPTVGTYLDEQPVTMADGALDIHIYDIQRVEALSGPQGTLYGASSEAGTVRIITNKPDPSGFKAGYDISGNTVSHGGQGYLVEGFVNIPLSPIAAIRLVGWDQHDAGFINNVAGTNPNACIKNGVMTYPSWSGNNKLYAFSTPPPPAGTFPLACPAPTTLGKGSVSNAAFVKDHYNKADTRGGRAALKLVLGDNWTISPVFMGQRASADGFFAYDPVVGDLRVTHFGPETSEDSFAQGALTVEGKIGNLDVVYAGALLKRSTHAVADYSDYSLFYDKLYGSGLYFYDNAGQLIDPRQQVNSSHHFLKWSNELRFSTPQDQPVKGTFGVFAQRQTHDIVEQYVIPGYSGTGADGLGDAYSVFFWKNTYWLTDQQRVDRDQAVFGQATWDITSQFALTGGLRYFKVDNTLEGYYGYRSAATKNCGPQATWRRFHDAPCDFFFRKVEENGHIPRVNLTYKINPDAMLYATFSKGFRPGGINRTTLSVGPYNADFLKNYEIGWKTQWDGHRLRWNGAVFREDWNDFQFSFLGPSSVNVIVNAGQARIWGIESDLQWAATSALTLGGAFTLLDPKLTSDYCGTQGVTSCPNQVNTFDDGLFTFNGPLAPSGSQLPVSKFKANIIARYSFGLGGWDANVQAAGVYQSAAPPLLKIPDIQRLGMLPAWGTLDLSGGADHNGLSFGLVISNVLDKRASLTNFAECNSTKCGVTYSVPNQPRTIAIKIGQKF